MHSLIQLKKAAPAFLIALVCFGLLPTMQAVSPPQDGGYPGGNTAEGQNALGTVTTGLYNSALGFLSLLSNADANFNTGVGAGTLLVNTADQNTATGAGALLSNTTGGFNTASGAFALFSNTSGIANTATGQFALFSNTTAGYNTATGSNALFSNTTGSLNTANGAFALSSNTTAGDNTATGVDALLNNTTGDANTANGVGALQSNATGSDNTATGQFALFSNTTGTFNSAFGQSALASNTTGIDNTATGAGALFSNTTGNSNTGAGFQALNDNTSGSNNTGIGNGALFNNTTGNANIALGVDAGFGVITANNVICIGTNLSGADVSSTTWVGNVYNTTTVSGTTLPVIVSDQGQLGTTPSSRRFKHEIKPMNNASESILGLKPVTFQYKSDNTGTTQFGLIAEDVAAVNPDLVVRDKNGEIYTVRYDAVNAMLLNEFLKEHRKVENLEVNAARQQKQIEALTAGLQKVSEQLEASKPASQVVNNP